MLIVALPAVYKWSRKWLPNSKEEQTEDLEKQESGGSQISILPKTEKRDPSTLPIVLVRSKHTSAKHELKGKLSTWRLIDKSEDDTT